MEAAEGMDAMTVVVLTRNGQLDRAVLDAIRDGNAQFKDILFVIVEKDSRKVDQSLQRLRRKGVIKFERGEWRCS